MKTIIYLLAGAFLVKCANAFLKPNRCFPPCTANEMCIYSDLLMDWHCVAKDPCRARLCPQNAPICIVKNGKAICVADPCWAMYCGPGTKCVVRGDRGFCKRTNLCADVKCEDYQRCVVRNGKGICEGNNPCHATLCLPPRPYCVVQNKRSRCIKDPCLAMYCPLGTKCEVRNGMGKCVPKPDVNPCDVVDCPENQPICVNEDGEAVCKMNPCWVMRCSPHSPICVVDDNGVGSCTKDPCLAMYCPLGTKCEVRNGMGKCVLKPDPCMSVVCDHEYQKCVVENDRGVCKGENPCNLIDCSPERPICVVENGNGVCKVNPCWLILCPKSKPVCVVRGNGEGMCENPCDRVRCPEKCVVIGTDPVCVEAEPCKNKVCSHGEVCVVENHVGVCKPDVNPCDVVDCPENQPICVNEDGEAVCKINPCWVMRCSSHSPVCVVDDNGVGSCTNPCDKVRCPDKCVVDGSKPVCVSCPIPTGFGVCAELCPLNEGCNAFEICCSNGCGHACMRPNLP